MQYPTSPATRRLVVFVLPVALAFACAQTNTGGGGSGGGSGGARAGGSGGASQGGSGGHTTGGAGGTSNTGGSGGGSGGKGGAGGSGGSSGAGEAGGSAGSGGGTAGTGGSGGHATGGWGGDATGGNTTGGSGGKGGSGGGSGGGAGNSGGAGSGGSGGSGGDATGGNTTGGSGGKGGSGGGSGGGAGNSGGAGSGGSSGAGGSGGSSGAGGSGSDYYGYLPVPTAANAPKADPAAWWASWKTAYYQDCSNGTGRIASNGNETVSEGIGYGMLMAANNDDRAVFDKLWAYYKAHEDANGLMNWKINACDSGYTGQWAATDGDEDAAMALVQADAKWGGYKSDATTLINAIKKYETAAGPPSYLLPGDAKGGWSAGTVNPSYFSPGYWHVWASYVSDDFWNTLASDAYTALAAYQTLTISNATGLVPNWGTISGTATDANYGYDACRTPWRVAIDYVWFQTAAAQTFLKNVSTYVDGKNGVANVPFDKNSAFVGAFALSGMAVSQAKADQYLNDWLSATLNDTPYFQGALKGLYLLVANHKFPRGN